MIGAVRVRAVFFLIFVAFVAGESHQQQPQSRIVTINRDVAPILYENCATCHRPIDGTRTASGDPVCFAGAPFSVLDYDALNRNG